MMCSGNMPRVWVGLRRCQGHSGSKMLMGPRLCGPVDRLLTTGTCRKLLSIMSSMAARTVSSGVTVFSTLSGVMISSTLSVALLLPDTTTFVR